MTESADFQTIYHSLNRVARGLSLVFTSLTISVFAFVVFMFSWMIFHADDDILKPMTLIFAVTLICSYIMNLVGHSMCLAVPEGTPARAYIWGAVTLDLVGLGIRMAHFVFELSSAFHLLDGIIELLGGILFMNFLRHTAELIRQPYLAVRARAILWNAMFICGSLLALFLFLVIARGGKPGARVVFMCGFMTLVGMGVTILIQYANLLRSLSRAIQVLLQHAAPFIGATDDSAVYGEPY